MRFLMALTLAGACFAQGPGPGRGPSGPGTAPLAGIKAYLTLTDAQVQSLQAIQQQQRQANTAAHQEMQTKQRALREAIAAGSTDAAAVGKLLLDIEATRKRIENSRGGYVDQAKNVLTAEQRTKLQALEAAQQLFDEAHQAVALNLLAAPMPGGGMGMGPALRLGGPAGRGMGPGGPGGPGRFRR